jgi:thymidine phosphorylase
MLQQDIIRHKRDGSRLSNSDLRAFIAGIVGGQMVALAMAALPKGPDDAHARCS